MLKKLSTFINFDQKTESNFRSNENYHSSNNAKDGFDFLHLIQSWSEIAGSKLSEHTIPLKNQNGTLIILSNHSAFANEMKFMEVPLKRKIFAKFPALEKSIKTINFIVDTTHFERQYNNFNSEAKTLKKELSMPHPFSPENKKLQKEAQEMFQNIDDEELKKSFCTLYIQSKFNSAN